MERGSLWAVKQNPTSVVETTKFGVAIAGQRAPAVPGGICIVRTGCLLLSSQASGHTITGNQRASLSTWQSDSALGGYGGSGCRGCLHHISLAGGPIFASEGFDRMYRFRGQAGAT